MSNEQGLTEPTNLRGFDNTGISGTSLDDVDLDAVARHIDIATKRQRLTTEMSPLEYLRDRQCIVEAGGQTVATPAGILCFGTNPQKLFPSAVVTLVKYRGVIPNAAEQVDLRRGIGGTLFDQIEYVEAYLRDNTLRKGSVQNGFNSTMQEEYPNIVRRELTLNALGHRSYENHNTAVRIQLFYDHLEVFNPGGVPEPLSQSIDEILKFHEPRNPTIFSILYDRGLVEVIGSGLDTVLATLREEKLPEPKFDLSNRAYFMVTVYGHPQGNFALSARYRQLTDRQLRILEYIRVRANTNESVAPAEIRQLIPESEASYRMVQRDLKQLVEMQILKLQGHAQTTRYTYIGDDV